MTDDDNNPIIPNWTGTSTNGGHENGEDLNALKLEMNVKNEENSL
jgi:hypothetical protein